MKILIIEDEASAARRLKKMIEENYPEFLVEGVTDSIESTLHWLKVYGVPDLILSDIQLADGLSFDIFKESDLECPIIFTTAFNQYAIDAFKLNSIDYLLKPIKKDELDNSLKKFLKYSQNREPSRIDYELLAKMISTSESTYQKRIVVRFGQHIKAIETKDIAHFHITERIIFLTNFEGMRYPVDYNLDQLEEIMDPTLFFRINRKCIVNFYSISEMFAFSKSRVKLVLKPSPDIDTIVSKERSPNFKEWLKGRNS